MSRLRIVRSKPTRPQPPTVMLSDIPVGQVFDGEITGPNSGTILQGPFYKHFGRWVLSNRMMEESMSATQMVLVLKPIDGFAPLITQNVEVRNYVALHATLALGEE